MWRQTVECVEVLAALEVWLGLSAQVGDHFAKSGAVEILLIQEGDRTGRDARTAEFAVGICTDEHNSRRGRKGFDLSNAVDTMLIAKYDVYKDQVWFDISDRLQGAHRILCLVDYN